MGSLILLALGVGTPLAAALAVLWIDERRRSHFKLRVERLAQDNRGLKMALDFPVESEIKALTNELAHKGILLEWLRLGAKPPGEAAAQLLGVEPQDAAHLQQTIADWGAQGVVVALAQLKERLASIAEMEMTWADPQASVEGDPSAMLVRAMWTFEPEFVVGEGRYSVDPRFGAIAKPATSKAAVPAINGTLA